MTQDFDTLSITNFRSIRGTVTIPLNAPITLLHGPNGAGKTSVLAALELALTGDITAMRQDDENFVRYLVYDGAERAEVRLSSASSPNLKFDRGAMSLKAGAAEVIEGSSFLDASDAKFFAERCYLAQSVLGRLLEIYQRADPERESALTRFVKDLLGLDHLDALVDGLHDAGDVRRTKNLVPAFRAADDLRKSLQVDSQNAQAELSAATTAFEDKKRAFVSRLSSLALPTGIAADDFGAFRNALSSSSEDSELINLAQRRREIASIRNALTSAATLTPAAEIAAAEKVETSSMREIAAWRSGEGAALEKLLDELRTTFPEIPSSASTNPQLAYDTATNRLSAEIRRLEVLIAQDTQAETNHAKFVEEIGRTDARIKLIDEQIGALSADAGELSRALAALLSHVHSDDCPVCGRNFGEISEEPLQGHLSKVIAQLSEQSARLASISQERNAATARLSGLQRQRDIEASKRLAPDGVLGSKRQLASLSGLRAGLDQIAPTLPVAMSMFAKAADAQKRLSAVRERDRIFVELRASTNNLALTILKAPLVESEPLDAAVGRLESHTATEISRLTQVQQAKKAAAEECSDLLKDQKRVVALTGEALTAALDLGAAEAKYDAADGVRLKAKGVASAAKDARTAVVRRVFNDSLNSLWRDLFIRLAPTEPFIPAFRLPETPDGVVAVLETLHRSGHRGGTPGSMLSAGNLNTAALTLFLALNLSVKPRMPWLVLDDPVQSMDEVHIAQFAALLRTLSKAHDRKIIIAVHDRPLFEYLALELSPAFPDDQLVTVELSRSGSETTAAAQFLHFKKDEAIAA